MVIGGFQKLTLLDYPGQIACIVFTAGCNFRCPFCHNSSLVLPCQGSGRGVEEDEILSYLRKRRKVLEGVVVTGGEPLLWSDLGTFLIKVRSLGYKIKLDTNGSFPEQLESLLEQRLADYVAMDIKQAPGRYETACGVDTVEIVPRIEKSLEILRNSGIPFELRTTLVKGIHRPEDMAAMAEWIAGPEHYYLQSYVDSGQILSPEGLDGFSEQEMAKMLELVRKNCPQAELRM